MPNVRDRRLAADQRELAELVEELGQGCVERLLDVHRSTVSRWLTGSVKPPKAVLIALRLEARGEVPGMGETWAGWRFHEGLLYSPEGYKFSAGDVRARVYEKALIRAQREQIEELERKLVAATKAAAATDQAANDLAVWPGDVRTKAFG